MAVQELKHSELQDFLIFTRIRAGPLSGVKRMINKIYLMYAFTGK